MLEDGARFGDASRSGDSFDPIYLMYFNGCLSATYRPTASKSGLCVTYILHLVLKYIFRFSVIDSIVILYFRPTASQIYLIYIIDFICDIV